MHGIDRSGSGSSGDRLDPRRRARSARVTEPGTATALRLDGFVAGLRTLIATFIASVERR